jgi:curved DNA-binding protein CbpA
MTTPKPDYYAVLGLPQTASQEEIKKRYRELARKYHPDVNPSPEAAQKIKAVNEAHRVLGDVERRSVYDAERALSAPPPPPPQPQSTPNASARRTAASPFTRPRPAASQPPPRAAAQPPPASSGRSSAPPRQESARPSGASQGSGSKPRVEFNGFGRVYPDATGGTTSAKRTVPDVTEEVKKLISEAETAFLTRNYQDAEKLCQEVLAKRRSAAPAHEILGDIYAMRGYTEQAIKAYSYAIQFDPRNYGIQGKLDRLIGSEDRAHPVVPRTKQAAARAGAAGRNSREAMMAAISVGLFILGCLGLASYGQNPGQPIGGAIPWLTSLSPGLIITLMVEGIVSGMLLAFYGRLRPVSEELTIRGNAGRAAKMPLLPLLMLFAIVWYYASLLVYVFAALSRSRFSASTVRIYGAVTALIALFTIMTAENQRGGIDWLAAAAFSGNVLFPAAIAGWFLGDLIRLRRK